MHNLIDREFFQMLTRPTLSRNLKRMLRDTLKTENVDRLQERADLADFIKDNTKAGKVAVEIWGIDCDTTESRYIRWIPATVHAYLSRLEKERKYAEGPCSVHILTLKQAEDYQPVTVDHALRAFENGHSHLVTI